MNPTIERTILSWIHLIFGMPLLGYIYGPAEAVPQDAPRFRIVFVPVPILAGLWMWKGAVARKLFSRKSE